MKSLNFKGLNEQPEKEQNLNRWSMSLSRDIWRPRALGEGVMNEGIQWESHQGFVISSEADQLGGGTIILHDSLISDSTFLLIVDLLLTMNTKGVPLESQEVAALASMSFRVTLQRSDGQQSNWGEEEARANCCLS